MQRTARLSVLAITAAALMALTTSATAGAAPAQSVVGNINVAEFQIPADQRLHLLKRLRTWIGYHSRNLACLLIMTD